MNATNTSLIKSPVIWQVNLQPSNLYAVLYWLSVLLALVALWLCPVHWGIRMLLILVTIAGGIKIFLPSRQYTSIAFCEDNSWLLVENSRLFYGRLSSGCYRSMLLVVLAIKPAQGPLRYAIAWRDSLSASEFSALHIRLALTAEHQLH